MFLAVSTIRRFLPALFSMLLFSLRHTQLLYWQAAWLAVLSCVLVSLFLIRVFLYGKFRFVLEYICCVLFCFLIEDNCVSFFPLYCISCVPSSFPLHLPGCQVLIIFFTSLQHLPSIFNLSLNFFFCLRPPGKTFPSNFSTALRNLCQRITFVWGFLFVCFLVGFICLLDIPGS